MKKEYEEMHCPYCEEWLPEWDMTYVESSEDYPRGTHMCLYHYEEEFPHEVCIVCRNKEAAHEMTPMGLWGDEELFFCAPCITTYPTPDKEASQ
jgi:hypothetical protein